MGASSVTGVGPGSGEYGVKGAGNGRNFFVSLNGPHVVVAEASALVGGVKTITFPTSLVGDKSAYVVILTSLASAAVYVSATANDSNGNFASFTATGTSTNGFNYCVVKAGQANLPND